MNYMLTGGMVHSDMIAPGYLSEIITKCTQMNPDDRYQVVGELRAALKSVY